MLRRARGPGVELFLDSSPCLSGLAPNWPPKVSRIMAFEALFGGLLAPVLHTFGVQVHA